MGKYLHRYLDLNDFDKDYNDYGVANSFTCSAGTFTYDRYEEIEGEPAYIWKNGDKELITPNRNPKVGVWDGDYDKGTGAYDIDNNTGVEITEVGEVEPGKYYEPWVSYTTYTAATQVSGDWWFAQEDGLVNQKEGTAVLKYVGKVDWEGTLC